MKNIKLSRYIISNKICDVVNDIYGFYTLPNMTMCGVITSIVKKVATYSISFSIKFKDNTNEYVIVIVETDSPTTRRITYRYYSSTTTLKRSTTSEIPIETLYEIEKLHNLYNKFCY